LPTGKKSAEYQDSITKEGEWMLIKNPQSRKKAKNATVGVMKILQK